MNENNLLDEDIPGFEVDEMPSDDEFYACPVGVALWEKYRAEHPDAPTEPPEGSEDLPDAVAYWKHASDCDNCNEV